MKSEFKFESYKIDTLNLSTAKTVDLLNFKGNIPTEKWNIDIRIRNPLYIKSRSSYISGLNIKLNVLEDIEGDKEPITLINVEAGISGLFKVANDRFIEDDEKNIVLIHFPALLLPYLRSALTGLIANAGIGTFIFPLINIPGLIKDAMKDIEIQIVE